MHTSVTFKNLDSSENLKSYVGDKLDRFDKYLYNPAEAKVVLSVEKFRHMAEINIIGDRLSIYGKEVTDDMYSAIDMVLDKLEKQIKKNKQKNRKHRSGSKSRTKDLLAEDSLHLEDEATGHIIVRNIDYKPMDVEEAVMQMDLVTDNFLVFTNARTDQVNVLYRRKNDDYGLIQPSN
ncbi:MAG: ribosome-associated translation inhibitor RaiA [Deltaproteobacteria bacterium]|jgi:putative sigma-54 modulation protein|nr:ribosome-associated translation inhibitor RaiA [Deltaproteobacteria bacterium]MBW2237590.1 ribosome-associated translation inhibitor RaiA [Deltaproteobacteria bacterium]MBW2572588.1 ribosome-associated translation inhibitor RaiA [Deltaproteobacteria bacterium]MBW2669514.1 ribosome-associated translation inhibitor RaiA [Deltaproteobacteria bacterium]